MRAPDRQTPPPPLPPSAVPSPVPSATEAQSRAFRRGRIRDAARLLPFLGLMLFILPDLVLSGSPAAQDATAPWLSYLLGAWAMLVVLSFWIGRLHLRGASDPVEERDP